ncbi:hypothetical protein Q604_UNBC04394G0001, partial [human gut metagenome]
MLQDLSGEAKYLLFDQMQLPFSTLVLRMQDQ